MSVPFCSLIIDLLKKFPSLLIMLSFKILKKMVNGVVTWCLIWFHFVLQKYLFVFLLLFFFVVVVFSAQLKALLQNVAAFYTPPHDSGGVLWFHVGHQCVHPSVHPSVVCMSIRPSIFRFQMIT